MNSKEKTVLYTLRYPSGFVFMNVVLYEGEEFKIEADTKDGGKNWNIIYKSKGEKT